MNPAWPQIHEPADLAVLHMSGSEPAFTPPMRGFLKNQFQELEAALQRGGLLTASCLGRASPWLFRFTLRTKGLVQSNPQAPPEMCERHDFALRLLPDYLRTANRFAMLVRLSLNDTVPYHPNISADGHVCVQIYPGEPLVAIALSLHDLIRGKLANVKEQDCLNPLACSYYRNHVQRPLDERPLFGASTKIRVERVTV